MKSQPYKVAAVQIAPVFFDREKTVEKTLRYLNEATRAGAMSRGITRALTCSSYRCFARQRP